MKHQASVYAMKKSEQQRLLMELNEKTAKEKFGKFTPKNAQRKRKVNSQIDRNLRKSERIARVKTLVRKFQKSAQNVADQQKAEGADKSRGAQVEFEKFHIPKYVPKLDSFEEITSTSAIKPSEIISRSQSRISAGIASDDESEDWSSDEENRHMLEEVAEAELDHIKNSTTTGGSLSTEGEDLADGDEEDTLGEKSLVLPEKYSMMERLINKEVGDQVITQLTMRMGGDAINVVVYWLAKEEALKINAFCFAG